MKFHIFRDAAGAELQRSRTTRADVITIRDGQRLRFKPLEIRPVAVHEERGLARRAAGGYLVLGNAGAAAGVLTGKGPTVQFVLIAADGASHQGIIAQKRYPRMRREIERLATYHPGDTRKLLLACAVFALVLLIVGKTLGPASALLGLIAGLIAKQRIERRIILRRASIVGGIA